jgi:hypothetical protein
MREYIKALGIQKHRAKKTEGVEQIIKADRLRVSRPLQNSKACATLRRLSSTVLPTYYSKCIIGYCVNLEVSPNFQQSLIYFAEFLNLSWLTIELR